MAHAKIKLYDQPVQRIVENVEQHVNVEKKLLRERMLGLRDRLQPEDIAERSGRICRRMTDWLTALADKKPEGDSLTVFTYVPFRSEADVTALIEYGWKHGWTILAPRVDRQKHCMHPHVIRGDSELAAGLWGMRQPLPDTPRWNGFEPIDAVIVPGLAFDREGRRLGYGGGYYDRFFAEYETRGLQAPAKLVPAFDFQLLRQVPADGHDVKVNVIFTEKQTLKA